MTYRIRKVAVLGAGVMGQGIAAHLANAGVPSVLYDIVPKDLGPGEPRSRLAIQGIENALKLRPAAFYRKEDKALITPANYEDDAELLAECDLIIEVVVERLDIKERVFEWVAKHRRPGSIVSSNTSGLLIRDMVRGMPEEMRKHFLVTHFFNPVRYMRLLEVVAGPDTLPEVVDAVADFGARRLGKGIVYAKDTPNFVANRIGVFGILSVFHHMLELGMTVEEVDAVLGPAMGRPKSAVFRTADLVGLDTLAHVVDNVHEGCPDDERRDLFRVPDFVKRMIEEGAVGDKAGRGFYRKTRDERGKRLILARDLETGEYRPKQKVRFPSVGRARGIDDVRKRLRAMFKADDKGALLAWKVSADTLIYAAHRIPEIADDIVNVDRAMRWGFAWELGPFESWDAIGVREAVERMQRDGLEVPRWVLDMLESGRENFYERGEDGRLTYWDPLAGEARPVPMKDDWLFIDDVVHDRKRIAHTNPSADLVDLGDGVALLRFKTKMHILDEENITLYNKALDELDAGKWEALVVGNQGGNAFCAGANLVMIGMAASMRQWRMLEDMVRGLQQTLQRAKYSERPVVVAPYGMTLGGGCEMSMQCAHTQAAAETYIGLVEVGVGVIPAGGGCKELLARTMGDIPEGVDYDPNPFVQGIFRNVGLAKVATSAEEAKALGYLRPTDGVTLDPDALIHDAKQAALGLVMAGYRPPRRRRIKVPGRSGASAIELFLYQMHEGGYATDHDLVVGRKLAWVLTGGDMPFGTWLTEEDILELERQAFVELCATEGTQARIRHFLETGKPLRN